MFFHNFDFESSKDYLHGLIFCADFNKKMLIQVWVTRTYTFKFNIANQNTLTKTDTYPLSYVVNQVMWMGKEEGLHDRLPRWNLHNSVEPQPLTSQFYSNLSFLNRNQRFLKKKKKLKNRLTLTLVDTHLTTMVSYGTPRQWKPVSCPHTIHPAWWWIGNTFPLGSSSQLTTVVSSVSVLY
jgi:hypothetical protein